MENSILDLLKQEETRQNRVFNLIASENYVSDNVKKASGSCLTNKYCEGYPGKRYYGGCEVADAIETRCQELWREIFHTDYHVNVQPHSGSNANLAVYMAVLKPGDKILSLGLNDGGHLSHGTRVNLSGKLYQVYNYGLDQRERINYNQLELMICKTFPKLIIAGASAYSRIIDFAKIRDIIERAKIAYNGVYKKNYEPIFMADIAHIAGLVAAGLHPSPFGLADVVTTTTHKTLRGARGGLIFCINRPELVSAIDKAVFPGMQGGPLMNQIAAKGVTAEEALGYPFKDYMLNVRLNAKAMAKEFSKLGYRIVSGGTDNHLFVLDLTDLGISGAEAERALADFNIIVNKNCIPNERRSPREASGIRIGTPAMTTKGFGPEEFKRLARTMDQILRGLQKKKQNETKEGKAE